MRHACTSPGSRSAPLVLSLARDPRLRCHSHVDERCAGFFALGLAKRSGLPAAVACTSGTAVAELPPAVIEAHEARVPAAGAERRPSGRAARERSRAGDRPAEAVRERREVVLRGLARRPRRPRAAALHPHARVPRLLDGPAGPARRRAPELPAARAAGERRGAARRPERPRRRAPPREPHGRAAAAPPPPSGSCAGS